MYRELWHEYAFDHATVDTLKRRHKKSEKWVRLTLDKYSLPSYTPTPRTMVAIGDATHLGNSWMMVIRDPHKRENVYLNEVTTESTSDYQLARAALKEQGVHFSAFVGDGRMAVPWLFSDIPVQMCHFHQEQIITRYTTQKPELPAGIEILELIRTLPHTDEDSFVDAFKLWCCTWNTFLNEKSQNLKTGKLQFTHPRLRSARNSITIHLPYLFTYQKYPDSHIPNTTNSLDGSFKKVKTAINVHSGLKHARKLKLVMSLLRGRV